MNNFNVRPGFSFLYNLTPFGLFRYEARNVDEELKTKVGKREKTWRRRRIVYTASPNA